MLASVDERPRLPLVLEPITYLEAIALEAVRQLVESLDLIAYRHGVSSLR